MHSRSYHLKVFGGYLLVMSLVLGIPTAIILINLNYNFHQSVPERPDYVSYFDISKSITLKNNKDLMIGSFNFWEERMNEITISLSADNIISYHVNERGKLIIEGINKGNVDIYFTYQEKVHFISNIIVQ